MKHPGIGMTSQRTRARLIERLFEQGITDVRVLEVMRSTPRRDVVAYRERGSIMVDTRISAGSDR